MMKNNQKINRSNRVLHYSLRKLSVGLVSVCLGATFALLGNQATAQADELPNQTTNREDGPDTLQATNTVRLKTQASLSSTQSDSASPVESSTTPDADSGSDQQSTTKDLSSQVVPIQTTVGQIPAAKAAFVDWEKSAENISTNNPDEFSADWATQPDVSKVGTTTGVLTVTYADNNNQRVTGKVQVPIIITAKDESFENRQADAGAKTVTNTVQFINAKTGEIIRVDRYIGNPGTNAGSWKNAIDSEYLRQSLNYAGYEVQDSDELDNALNLGDADQYFSIYLDPVKENPDSDDQQEVKPFLRTQVSSPKFADVLTYLKSGNVKDLPDPANFIANMNQLPADTKVSWVVAPKYEKVDDDSQVPFPDNYELNPDIIPKIKVTYNGHTIVFGGKDSEGNPDENASTLINDVALPQGEMVSVKGNVQVLQNGQLPAANDMVVDSELDAPNFHWVLKPDLRHVGYSYGSVVEEGNDGQNNSLYVMVKVVAPQSQTDTMTVTRTIHYDVTGTGHAAIPDQTQTVEYYRTKTVNPINNQLISYGNWTSLNAQFPSQDVQQIPDYDSYVDGIKASQVPAAEVFTVNGVSQDGLTVNVTYQAQTTPVTPNHPEVTPDNPAYQDLFRTVTRTIIVHNQVTGQAETAKQTVVFGRTGIYNQASKQFTSFGAWHVYADGALTDESNGSWAEFTAPEFAGYTPSQAIVDSETVNTDTADQTVEITYSKNNQDKPQPGDKPGQGKTIPGKPATKIWLACWPWLLKNVLNL